jgi:four helix bundle protein
MSSSQTEAPRGPTGISLLALVLLRETDTLTRSCFPGTPSEGDAMHNFRKLQVYQKSLALATRVQKVTRTFPRDELFGLTSQLRRASYSIPLNIAEGTGCRTGRDFARYIDHALGSGYESLACLDLALATEIIDSTTHRELDRQLDEIIAMLVGLQRSILCSSAVKAA